MVAGGGVFEVEVPTEECIERFLISLSWELELCGRRMKMPSSSSLSVHMCRFFSEP